MRISRYWILVMASVVTSMALPLGDADEDYIEDGDMRIPARSVQRLQRGMLPELTWPDGIVPYNINSNFTDAERTVIADGIAEIEKYTCVKFVSWVDQKTYVDIYKGKGCWSMVGYHHGANGLKLSLESPGCVAHRTVVHELMHSLGVFHEQNREDRDYSVVILLDNVSPSENGLMKLYGAVSLGIPYNVESVMQYRPKDYSINGKPTIVSTRPHHPIDNTKIAWSDFRRLNRLYGCPASHEAALDKIEFDD